MDVKEKYLKAGNIAGTAAQYGSTLIKVGASLLEVTEKVEQKIIELGGEFAFPPQISLNEVAAHYCAHPGDKVVFKEGDIAKLDVGVMIEGYIGDTAVTVDLGGHEKLVNASRDALNAAIRIAKPGTTIGEIGRAIHDSIVKSGYSPVRNLSGHGLAQYVFHDKPSIPNYDTGDKTVLKAGMIIAIEPFASSGAGMIYESSNPTIFSQIARKPVRNIITRQVLQDIEKYKAMPFTTRWLLKKYPEFKVSFALRELIMLGILATYPPLPDQKAGMISQAEHTLIIEDTPIVTTRV
ncbi:MAG: type II methionyl aminopeptidase [Nanoarchaeota archaeon]|nr:type II methionyl aminopeptidase [Nanoarchaeota archaeon]